MFSALTIEGREKRAVINIGTIIYIADRVIGLIFRKVKELTRESTDFILFWGPTLLFVCFNLGKFFILFFYQNNIAI